MKLKNISIIAILFLLAMNISIAQEKKQDNLLIFINPQYLITNGLRIDIDFRKPESNKWWVISPYYYSDRTSRGILKFSLDQNLDFDSEFHKYEEMYGLGLGITRKIFFRAKPEAKGLYVMAGISYKYFNILGDNLTYVGSTGTDGLPYYEMKDLEYTININNYNGFAALGMQFKPRSNFFIDLYLGFGLKYSTHSSPEKVAVKYNRGNVDFGYSGTILIGGARFGVAL